MQLAKVIGTVVATQKDPRLYGVKLLIIQPLNGKEEPDGKPIVACDAVGAGNGEFVFYAKSKEGAFALPDQGACVDASVTGIIDYVYAKYEG